MAPYKVLGIYKPSIWKSWVVGRDLVALTRRLGLVPFPSTDTRYESAPWSSRVDHAHVRRKTLRKQDGAQWHQDGDYGHLPMDHGLVFWSNKTPTEFKVGGLVYQPRPFEVVLFRNLEGMHRRPPEAERRRWLFRQRVRP